MDKHLQSYHSKHTGGEESPRIIRPVKIRDWGKGLRDTFYGEMFFIALFPPIAWVLGYWGIVASSFVWGDASAPTSWENIGWVSLVLFLIILAFSLKFAGEHFQIGASFHCPHCGQFIPYNISWTCGACAHSNWPNYQAGWYNHLFRSCSHCKTAPTGLLCINKACRQWIKLVPGTLQMPVGYTPPPPEHPEIAQLRQQQEVERAKRQFQEELEREKRRARGKQLSSDLEILADKISLTKQFELDALTMVKKLKDAGTLDAYEERVLLEMIRDKVLEEFHVDRRGGRSRH